MTLDDYKRLTLTEERELHAALTAQIEAANEANAIQPKDMRK